MKTVNYRVKPVTRYIVTKFTSDGDRGLGVETVGEFPNQDAANRCAYSSAFTDAFDKDTTAHYRLYHIGADEEMPSVEVAIPADWVQE